MQFIIQRVHHCINIFNLSLSTSMDSVFQHGSSSGYIHDGPDFLIAQQHLQAVADMLASTTFQAMDVDPRADATASLSAIRAILSPESREIRAELAEEAKRDGLMHGNALESIGERLASRAHDGAQSDEQALPAHRLPPAIRARRRGLLADASALRRYIVSVS